MRGQTCPSAVKLSITLYLTILSTARIQTTVFRHVINDDVALKLWSFNEADQTYDHEVPFVGPLCCSEGNNIMVAFGCPQNQSNLFALRLIFR